MSPSSSQASLDPQSGDSALQRGNVYINEVQILILESWPAQVKLQVNGDLPTPCNQLRAVVSEPGSENRIDVEIYSLVDPALSCIQVLEPFDVTLSLGSFTEGHFTVWINGEQKAYFAL